MLKIIRPSEPKTMYRNCPGKLVKKLDLRISLCGSCEEHIF
jgi:hypothetical protein